eukprot:7360477-Alexandrium_andersonii.AAC.1
MGGSCGGGRELAGPPLGLRKRFHQRTAGGLAAQCALMSLARTGYHPWAKIKTTCDSSYTP